jgi:hypothetical protein
MTFARGCRRSPAAAAAAATTMMTTVTGWAVATAMATMTKVTVTLPASVAAPSASGLEAKEAMMRRRKEAMKEAKQPDQLPPSPHPAKNLLVPPHPCGHHPAHAQHWLARSHPAPSHPVLLPVHLGE